MIRDKKKKVALIYEGVKTEENLFHNLQNTFFNNRAELIIVTLPADGNIYMLWNRLREDQFETELGKLYISYPMIESIKEISIKDRDYKTLYLSLEECGNYKQTVGGISDYSDFRYITREMWHIACEASRKRASLIVLFRMVCTYEEFINKLSQERIYEAQKNNFIRMNKMIGVLNAVPLFLIEYYGEGLWIDCGISS